MKKLYFVTPDNRVALCDTVSEKCQHQHHYFLSNAAREISTTYSKKYHLDFHGEIERCVKPDKCFNQKHFDSRAEVVNFHQKNYDFSNKYRKTVNPYVSLIEKEFADFVSLLPYRVITNSRDIISPYEIDVYLPDRDIAFEFNGEHYHSEENIQQRYGISAEAYHSKKLNRCYEQNIKLGFIWESSWTHDWVTVIDAVSDFIQFKKPSKLLGHISAPPAPVDVFWEKIDREGSVKRRKIAEKKLIRRIMLTKTA